MGRVENPVQRAVLDLLACERIWHRRFNTGAITFEATEKSKKRFVSFGSKGMGDVLATPLISTSVVHGSDHLPHFLVAILWIECKAPGEKQSKAQKEFEQEAKLAGHFYIVAWSSDDVLGWLRTHGHARNRVLR